MLLTFLIVTFIHGVIWPRFLAFAVLLIIAPFTLIDSSIEMPIDALSMRLVVLPLSLIDVTI
jgi:hypothetical protein